MDQLVRKLDHVYAVLDDAEAAHRFLVDRLGLPIAWPFSSYGTFASGGVGLGNLNLEFVSAGPGEESQHPARLTGVALEPAVAADEAFLAELDRRGIEHSPLMPTPGWTNVGLACEDLGPFVFVCDYHVPAPKDALGRRALLDECGGGELRVREAAEIVLGTPNMEQSEDAWSRLLDPLEPGTAERWVLGSGPALRFVSHPRMEILDLVIAVEDPEAASRRWVELAAEADPLDGLPLSFSAA